MLAGPAADPRRRDRCRGPLDLAADPHRAERLHAVTYTGPAWTFRQITEPSKPQRDVLAALGLDPPKKIIEISAKP